MPMDIVLRFVTAIFSDLLGLYSFMVSLIQAEETFSSFITEKYMSCGHVLLKDFSSVLDV